MGSEWRRNLRMHLMLMQGGKCFYCGRRMTPPCADRKRIASDATFDHIVPRSLGGRDRNNIVLACFVCNAERGTRDATEFLAEKMGVAQGAAS